MASIISIDAFSKLRLQKETHWANGIVWHTVSDKMYCARQGILVMKLWNRNCGISEKSKIMYLEEYLSYLTNAGNTIVNEQSYLAHLENNHSQSISKPKNDYLVLVSQTLRDAVTL